MIMTGTGMTARIDDFGRRHPAVMLLVVILLTIFVTVVLLYQDDAPRVLYEEF